MSRTSTMLRAIQRAHDRAMNAIYAQWHAAVDAADRVHADDRALRDLAVAAATAVEAYRIAALEARMSAKYAAADPKGHADALRRYPFHGCRKAPPTITVAWHG